MPIGNRAVGVLTDTLFSLALTGAALVADLIGRERSRRFHRPPAGELRAGLA